MKRRHFFGLLPALPLLPTWTTIDKTKEFRSVYVFRNLEWVEIDWLEIKKGMLVKLEYLPDENMEADYCYANSDGDLNDNGIPYFVSEPMKFHDADISFDLVHPRKGKHGRIVQREMTFLNSCKDPIINHTEKRKI